MTTYDQLLIALSALSPTYLSLDNESHNHHGYYEGKESHFKLVIVSQDFLGLRLAQRHQKIYALIDALLMRSGGSIHALAIHAYTPDEWQAIDKAPTSPNCQGKNL